MSEAERQPSPLDILRDRRAIVDTGLGPVAFVSVNALTDLETAAVVALAISVVIALFRALRREPLTNAFAGVLGTGLAVYIALRTGTAEGYFVPRALQNTGLALAFTASVAFRRPIVGYVVAALYRLPGSWVRDPRMRRAFAEASLAFAALFTLRAVVYSVLIAAGREGALAGAVIVLGWPAFLGVLWFTYRYVPRRLTQLGVDVDAIRQRS
ncbi:MAG: DUF3159 domain-containing protein [Solirubrobacteraceae bacterium]